MSAHQSAVIRELSESVGVTVSSIAVSSAALCDAAAGPAAALPAILAARLAGSGARLSFSSRSAASCTRGGSGTKGE